MIARYLHPCDEIPLAMERIYRYRMTTTSGGNLSIREENGDFWITPTRVDKGALRREDIVRIRSGGDLQFTYPAVVAALISPTRPSIILENDGVLATGADMLEAIDRLEVLGRHAIASKASSVLISIAGRSVR